MTKQDSVTEQHISKPRDSGKTDSNQAVPDWHQGPKNLTSLEDLRRRHKKIFGFKPCGINEKELERKVLAAEEASKYNRFPSKLVPQDRATIGDALDAKRRLQE